MSYRTPTADADADNHLDRDAINSDDQSVVLGNTMAKEPLTDGVPVDRLDGEPYDETAQQRDPSFIGTVCSILGNVMPAGGLLSTGFNMASTSIGAGILGLPAAFNSVGIIMAVIYLTLITAETVYSMRLLVVTASKTGLSTYEEMARFLVHPRFILLVAAVRFLHCFGACIAYVVTIGNLITPILNEALDDGHYLRSTSGTRLLQAALWLVFFLPLSIPREINSLRYVSAFGLFMVLFFCFCIIAHSAMNGLKADPRPETRLVNTGNDAINGLGVFIFSYMCQVNAVEIATEMTTRSVKSFTLCAVVSMTVCGILYFLVGLFGYMDFGDTVTGSVLLMFNPLSEPVFMVSYIGVFIKVCASYGLLGNACRCAIYQVMGTSYMTVPMWKHLIVAISVAVGSLIGGLFIPNVNMVFGFVGGFCGGFIAFVLPAIYWMYSGNWNLKSVGIVNYVATYLVLFAGVVAIVFGTGSTIYSAVVD